MKVFVVMRHITYECGEALGVAASLDQAQALASVAARVTGDLEDEASLDRWEQAREDIWTCDRGIICFEIRAFHVHGSGS